MDQYVMDGQFIRQDETRFREAEEEEYGVPGVLLVGGVGCRGNIVIAVKKFLEILSAPDDADPLIETRFYKYNVVVRGIGRDKGNVFRYDNDHPYWLHPGHSDPHHKHVFDWQTGNELKESPVCSPHWVGAHRWPHFHTVIEEVRGWYYDNRTMLPNPEGFPSIAETR